MSRNRGGKEVFLAYIQAGHCVGEMSLLSDRPRLATVRAAVRTETIRLQGRAFKGLLAQYPSLREAMQGQYKERLLERATATQQSDHSDRSLFLLQQGLGEATNVLLIDESICVDCDHCVKACAATHDETSRLHRGSGPTFNNLHVPTSCRHCEHPHCMKDCPPDAIHRSGNGEIYIDDSCIGCGNCVENCPYDVIHMASVDSRPRGLLSWLLFGLGQEPGSGHGQESAGRTVAVKCDLCKDISGGPACVRACPTGAAFRIEPGQIIGE